MEQKLSIRSLTLVVICGGIIGCSYGTTFYVGGKNGWVVDPRESYNHWAERNRFQVNDTLVFKYKKGLDSVLVVNEEAYHRCNKTNPVQTLVNDGNSVFKFKRSGPFFFISGQDDKCENGQKLIIVVMAVRSHHSTPPTPPPVMTTPTPEPVSLVPVVAPSTMLQGTDRPKIHAPAPATATSGVTTTCVGGSIGLILGLSLVLKMF